MKVGHTRCYVDGEFDFLKQKYWKTNVDTVAQLSEGVNDLVGFNKPDVHIRDWKGGDTFSAQLFNPVRTSQDSRFLYSSSNVKINNSEWQHSPYDKLISWC